MASDLHRRDFFAGLVDGVLRTSTQGYLCDDVRILVHQLVRCNAARIIALNEMAQQVVEGTIGVVPGLLSTQVRGNSAKRDVINPSFNV